jgi:hypothetical protein
MAGRFPGPDSKFQVGVITDQKAEDHSSNQGAFAALDWGDNVNIEDSSLSSLLNSPTAFMQQAFSGGLDPGTPVIMLKQAGELGGIILGQSNTTRKGGEGAGGGKSLGGAQKVSQLVNTKRNINVAPDVKETEVDGVKVRQINEKGKQHSLDLLDGLPIHGALFDMAGFRLPDIAKVPTAKQTNDGMMSIQNLQQMMGQIMSLGQMIQGLAGNKGGGGGAGGYGAGGTAGVGSGGNSVSYAEYTPPGANIGAGGLEYGGGLGNNIISAVEAAPGTALYEIMDGINPAMKNAVNSLSILLQGYEAQDGVAYYTTNVVHEDTYLENARDLLSQVQTLDDLMYVLSRLQWDKSLHGTEKLANVVNEIQTAWGVALQEIDVNGNIVLTYGSEDANLEMEFANTMTSNTGSPALGFMSPDVDVAYSINATGASLGFNNINLGGMPDAGTGGGGGDGGGGGGGKGSSSSGAGGVADAIGKAQNMLNQIQGLAQGMNQNMFGEAAGTMKDMWKRMTREQENDAKKMHEKLNQDGDAKDLTKVVEKTVKGGKNPVKTVKKKPTTGGSVPATPQNSVTSLSYGG